MRGLFPNAGIRRLAHKGSALARSICHCVRLQSLSPPSRPLRLPPHNQPRLVARSKCESPEGKKMLGGRSIWVRFSSHFRYLQHRRFCNNNNNPTSLIKQPPSTNGKSSSSNNDGGRNSIRDLEGYRDLDKLDFTKAAKILFSDTPRKKKFGVDFHLVQLFFALMPSFAVYLVAQYARHEMRKMEAELEEKKKAEEEKKAKEAEKLAEEERGHGSDPELLKVKERLEALEETIKEIVVEAKKQSSDEKSTRGNQNQERTVPKSRSDDSHAAVGKQYTPQPGLGQEQKHQDSENRGSHQVDKK